MKIQNKYEILTPDGWSDFHGVRKQITNGIVTLSFDNKTVLECSFNHSLECKHGFEEAQNLTVGDEVMTSDGFVKLTCVDKDELRTAAVYDALHVIKNNKYYTNNLVSHNCQFIGSSGTLIGGSYLKEFVYKNPIKDSAGVKMYFEPEVGNQYAIIVDVSRGKGLDYSAFQVIDVTKMPYQQVCVYKNNFITPSEYSDVIFRFGKLYNEAFVLVENNDIGAQVADMLYMDLEYENVLSTETAGRSGKRISGGFGPKAERGIRTTKTVKSVGCSILKLLIEQRQLIINDFDTINEFSTFSRRGNSYEAESGNHDDLVMCLVLFAWLSDQQYFKDMTDINTLRKLKERSEHEMMEDLLPFGVFDDGLDDVQVEVDSSGRLSFDVDDMVRTSNYERF